MFWNIFKIIKEKRKKARLLAENKVLKIKQEIKSLEDKIKKIIQEDNKASFEYAKRFNSTCPKCGSNNVNDRIKRQQGSLDGEINGSSWNALTFGSSTLSGRIHGEMDTNEVNKCNDCEHEWKKNNPNYTWSSDAITSKVRDIYYILDAYYDAKNCKFDSLDINEKYSSLADKKAVLLREATENWRYPSAKEFWNGVSLDTLNELSKKYLNSYQYEGFIKSYDESILLNIGLKN